MFEKILKELKTKYAHLGLSETILKAKAKQLAKAVEKEEEIEAAVEGIEDDLAIFQSFADQNRTLAKKLEELEKLKGEQKPKDDETPKPTDEVKPAGNDVPEWAKALIESNKTLSESLTAIKAKEVQQTNAQKLQAKLDELKVSKSIQALVPSNLSFENEEQIDAYAEEMKTKSDAIAQEFGNNALSGVPKPLFGEVKEGGVSNAMQNYVNSKKPKE